MSIHIETACCYIRELLPADEAGMFAMDSDPEVHRYLGSKLVTTPGESGAVIDFVRQQYTDNGIGCWAIIEKDSGGFVGWTGYKLMREQVNGHVNHYDFGYRLARKYWGKGIASETARAALDYGIDELDFKRIYAMTEVENGASRRVLEKLGFRLVEIFSYDGQPGWRTGQPITWYKLLDERLNPDNQIL